MNYRFIRKASLLVIAIAIIITIGYGLLLFALLNDSVVIIQQLSLSVNQVSQVRFIQQALGSLSQLKMLLYMGSIALVFIFFAGILVNQLFKELWRNQKWKNQAKKFQNLVNILPVATLITDEAGDIILANQSLAKLLGQSRSKLIGRNISNVLSLSSKQLVDNNDEQFIHLENCEFDDEHIIDVDVNIQRIELDSDVCFLVAVNNVSELVNDRKELKKQRDKLRKLSISDELTHIANRRRFDEFFADSHASATRDRRPLSLLLLDIDCFKQYNDFYGHSKGDRALKKVAKALKQKFKRRVDLCARIGGEEFACVLNGVDIAVATNMADELRKAIKLLAIEHQNSVAGDVVTVSIGISCFDPNIERLTLFKLFEQADEALYQAKSDGRDCVRQFLGDKQLQLIEAEKNSVVPFKSKKSKREKK